MWTNVLRLPGSLGGSEFNFEPTVSKRTPQHSTTSSRMNTAQSTGRPAKGSRQQKSTDKPDSGLSRPSSVETYGSRPGSLQSKETSVSQPATPHSKERTGSQPGSPHSKERYDRQPDTTEPSHRSASTPGTAQSTYRSSSRPVTAQSIDTIGSRSENAQSRESQTLTVESTERPDSQRSSALSTPVTESGRSSPAWSSQSNTPVESPVHERTSTGSPRTEPSDLPPAAGSPVKRKKRWASRKKKMSIAESRKMSSASTSENDLIHRDATPVENILDEFDPKTHPNQGQKPRNRSVLTSNSSQTNKYYPRHWGHLVNENQNRTGRGRSFMYRMSTADISEEQLLKDDRTDMLAATSVLQQQAAEIRGPKVKWQSYLQSHMISQEDYTFIVAYENADSAGRETLLKENRAQCAKTFLNLLGHISKDNTIRYILVLIDDMLQEDPSRVEIFKEHAAHKKESVWTPFLNLLNRPDGFIQNMTSRIIAKIACWAKDPMDRSDLHFYLTYLKDQLKLQSEAIKEAAATDIPEPPSSESVATSSETSPLQIEELMNNEYMQSVARCLQMMLRVDEYRFAFVAVDGISTILTILQSRLNFQIQYQLIFCLWVLTFNPLLAEKMNKFNVIPILADILSDSVKEKVTRIILAVFRNLIEKPEDTQVSKEHCIAMVQCKVLKQLNILHQRKFDDEDITNDIQFLDEKLQASVQDLSSFDEYATEVKSGRLEWSPVHKSAKFWRENAPKLNEKNYELLRILIHLLETSKDPLVLSVASYDIGEYVRHYPRGKNVIEQLGGKQLVMQLLSHDDPNVRYEALLAVQKLMVHNWEYLGKQLEKDKDTQAPKQAGAAKA